MQKLHTAFTFAALISLLLWLRACNEVLGAAIEQSDGGNRHGPELEFVGYAILPSIWIVWRVIAGFRSDMKAWLRRTWRAQVRCLECGYDLTASPIRCPECGQ